MGEGEILASALERARRGNLHLLWLERRDVLPKGARYLAPVWDPASMERLISSAPKRMPRSVMVAFQGSYPRAAKNILASLAGCAATGASLHLSGSALEGTRGLGAKEILRSVPWTSYGFLPRAEVVRLAASVEVMCHVSITDTWPYLVMEAVYAGTPVVLSDAIAWTRELPQWAQDLCIVRPHTKSTAIKEKVAYLLDRSAERYRLASAQKSCLDRLAPTHLAEAARTLSGLGYRIPPR
jgi:glycosyltransferase involved in cell wall biosynthesis